MSQSDKEKDGKEDDKNKQVKALAEQSSEDESDAVKSKPQSDEKLTTEDKPRDINEIEDPYELKGNYQVLQAECDKKEKELEVANKQLDQLKSEMKEKDALHAVLKKKEEETLATINRLTKEIKELKMELEKAKEEIDRLIEERLYRKQLSLRQPVQADSQQMNILIVRRQMEDLSRQISELQCGMSQCSSRLEEKLEQKLEQTLEQKFEDQTLRMDKQLAQKFEDQTLKIEQKIEQKLEDQTLRIKHEREDQIVQEEREEEPKVQYSLSETATTPHQTTEVTQLSEPTDTVPSQAGNTEGSIVTGTNSSVPKVYMTYKKD